MGIEVLAIIPARGGSKGIPRKNLALVGGRSLLDHTVAHALRAKTVTRTVVSTDDDEIAAAALAAGAEVVRRPAEIAGDTATSESALVHTLGELSARMDYRPDLVVFLQATSPLRRPVDIDAAIQTLLREEADSVFSACRVEGFIWRRCETGLRSLTYDHSARPRRQDIGTDFLENGSIYVFRPWVLQQLGNRLGGRIAVYEMDPLHSFQVDEPADLDLMQRLMTRLDVQITPNLSRVRLLILDFDGVMTDNRVIVQQDGTESVVCHRGDGLGIERVRAAGVKVVVLSKETNPVVNARSTKLGIECIQACNSKLAAIMKMAEEGNLDAAQIAYVGNDINDIECLQWCGVGIAVADAHESVRLVADWVITKAGGSGAVREVCDQLLKDHAEMGLSHKERPSNKAQHGNAGPAAP